MATQDIQGKGKRFGEGQDNRRGGRPKKNSVLIELEKIAESEGCMILEKSDFKILEDGRVEVVLPTPSNIAMKLVQMVMKGDMRAMDMYFKLTGAYKAERHEVEITPNPLSGKDLFQLSEKDRQM